MHTAITIDALKVLDAIDRKGSFAGAASELFRVPSAISYTVQKLEEDLNVSIFDRSGHKAVLTSAGRYLLEEGRSLLEAAENLAHTTRQVAQGWETRLRIGFNSLLPAECLFPAIQDFHQLGVPVDVQIIEEVFAGAWDALQSRRVDMVVGADLLSKPAGAVATNPLGEVPFVSAVGAEHPLASETGPLAEADIAQYPAAVAADTSRSLPPGHAGIFRLQRTLTVSNTDHHHRSMQKQHRKSDYTSPRKTETIINSNLQNKDIIIVCLNHPQMTKKWAYRIGFVNDDIGYDLIETKNGNIALDGSIIIGNNTFSSISKILFDRNGKLIFEKTYIGTGCFMDQEDRSIIQTSDLSLLSIGYNIDINSKISFLIKLVFIGSKPLKGSSKINKAGCFTNARAINTNRCWP